MIIGLKDVFGSEISVFEKSFGNADPKTVADILIRCYSSPTKQGLDFTDPIARTSNTGAFVNQVLKKAGISGFLYSDGGWWVFDPKADKFKALPGQQLTIEIEE